MWKFNVNTQILSKKKKNKKIKNITIVNRKREQQNKEQQWARRFDWNGIAWICWACLFICLLFVSFIHPFTHSVVFWFLCLLICERNTHTKKKCRWVFACICCDFQGEACCCFFSASFTFNTFFYEEELVHLYHIFNIISYLKTRKQRAHTRTHH